MHQRQPHLCAGCACALTMARMSSGVRSASPLRALRMKPDGKEERGYVPEGGEDATRGRA